MDYTRYCIYITMTQGLIHELILQGTQEDKYELNLRKSKASSGAPEG